MADYQVEFIKNLKFYRAKKGISQAKLAELCDCGTGTIGSIESSRQFPSFDLLFKISDVLEINPADLFIRDASKSKNNIREELEETLVKNLKSTLDEIMG